MWVVVCNYDHFIHSRVVQKCMFNLIQNAKNKIPNNFFTKSLSQSFIEFCNSITSYKHLYILKVLDFVRNKNFKRIVIHLLW